MMTDRYKDEDWLREQFVDKELTHVEISKKCSCSGVTVGNWINKFGIEREEPKYKDKEWLEEQFVERDRTSVDIADELGYSKAAVLNYVHEFGLEEERPWRDESVLRELYWEENLSATEVSNELNCEQKTVLTWMGRLDIPRRETSDYFDSPWDDEELLERLYIEKEENIDEISDRFDCCPSTIYETLNKYGFHTGSENLIPKMHVTKDGYENVNGDGGKLLIHRLLAVCEFGFDEVCDMDVHHKNGVPWDNRVENLELMTDGEHSSHHINERLERGEQLFEPL